MLALPLCWGPDDQRKLSQRFMTWLYDPGVITAIALEMDRTHPLVPAHEISPGSKSKESGPDRQ